MTASIAGSAFQAAVRRSRNSAAARSGSSARAIARDTATRRAPAERTASRESSVMPPAANQGFDDGSEGGATLAAASATLP